MMSERLRLLKQIEDAKSQLDILDKQESSDMRVSAIKELEEYTTQEKVEFFNKLYGEAIKELVTLETEHYDDEDNKQYDWESYIEILSRNKKKFWTYWNSLA